jgi:hypothetical protein
MRFTEESRDDHLSRTLVSDPIPEPSPHWPHPGVQGHPLLGHNVPMSDAGSGFTAPVRWPPAGAGGLVSWHVAFGDSSIMSAVLRGFAAYPSGVRFSLDARFGVGVFDPLGAFPGAPGGAHVAVIFADGRTGMVMPPGYYLYPAQVILSYFSGGGNTANWTMRLWLSPLPPPGPLTFGIGWPDKDVPITEVTVEAAELRYAALPAKPLG